MKKTIVSLLLVTSFPLVAMAGVTPNKPAPVEASSALPDGPAPGEENFKRHHAHKIEMMAKELGLSVEQKTKVDAIFEEQRTKFQAIHQETKTRLQSVLTPEQLKKFEDRHPPRHMMPPPPPPKPE